MIALSHIEKHYVMGDEMVYALRDVSAFIDSHEYVAIIGPSGSGKSTLMNIIGCLDTADAGTYELDGQDITRYSERQLATIRNKKIGFIFQQFNLLQKMTAYGNVELPLIYQGMGATERRKRTLEALDMVGLGKRMGHRPNQLSGGQQQRVAIARALVTRPSILLADEPTGNLDSKTSKEIMAMLDDLHRQGNCIVLITHDVDVAARAPRRVQIHDGQLTEGGGKTVKPPASGKEGEALASGTMY